MCPQASERHPRLLSVHLRCSPTATKAAIACICGAAPRRRPSLTRCPALAVTACHPSGPHGHATHAAAGGGCSHVTLGCRLWAADTGLQTVGCRLWAADCGLQTVSCSPTAKPHLYRDQPGGRQPAASSAGASDLHVDQVERDAAAEQGLHGELEGLHSPSKHLEVEHDARLHLHGKGGHVLRDAARAQRRCWGGLGGKWGARRKAGRGEGWRRRHGWRWRRRSRLTSGGSGWREWGQWWRWLVRGRRQRGRELRRRGRQGGRAQVETAAAALAVQLFEVAARDLMEEVVAGEIVCEPAGVGAVLGWRGWRRRGRRRRRRRRGRRW